MKKIISKILIIFALSFIILNIVSYLIISNSILSNKFKIYSIGAEVYNAIALSNKVHASKRTLMLGDSVAKQLIDQNISIKTDTIDLTCNQAISLAGNYDLLLNVLKYNKQVRRIYLLYRVNSFENNLNQKWTYNFFILPFYRRHEATFTVNTQEIVQTKLYWLFYRLPIAKVLPVFGNIDYSDKYKDTKQDIKLSATSIEYLKMIQEVCRAHNVDFKILPVPVSIIKLGAYDYFKYQISVNKLDEMFSRYFDKFIVLDDGFYKQDQVHIKNQYVGFVSDFSLNYIGLFDEFEKPLK